MTLQWILSWWNLIFVLPFALALVYLGLYTVSGVTFGEADADTDFDADADFHLDADADGDFHADVDHDADMDGPHADVDSDADADSDADTDADSDGDAPDNHAAPSSGGWAALQWFGLGRVPLSITLMVMMFTWGWIGFVANFLLQPRVTPAWRVALASVPIAAGMSLVLTRLVVMAIDRWMPLNETSARRRHELLGCEGEAIFVIDEKFGMASVRDDQGDLYQIPCRTAPGTPPIPKCGRVKLVAYSGKRNMFQVVSWSGQN